MIKLLEEIDELLTFLEDTAHGEEGKRITEMRYKILTELSNSHKHGVSGKRPDIDFEGEFSVAKRALKRLDPSGENIDAVHIYEILQAFKDELAACASGGEDKTVSVDKNDQKAELDRPD